MWTLGTEWAWFKTPLKTGLKRVFKTPFNLKLGIDVHLTV